MEERHLREERDALRAAAEKLRERLREEAVDRLARLVIGPEDAHTGADRAQEIRGGGALLALCLLQVRAELLLCAQPASASRESLTSCVAEVFRSAGQAVEIPGRSRTTFWGRGCCCKAVPTPIGSGTSCWTASPPGNWNSCRPGRTSRRRTSGR